eukprot:4884958-Amphidinium_carterae.1
MPLDSQPNSMTRQLDFFCEENSFTQNITVVPSILRNCATSALNLAQVLKTTLERRRRILEGIAPNNPHSRDQLRHRNPTKNESSNPPRRRV